MNRDSRARFRKWWSRPLNRVEMWIWYAAVIVQVGVLIRIGWEIGGRIVYD